MCKRYNKVSDINKKSVMFDANIFLYIFFQFSISNRSKHVIKVYSSIFKHLIKNKNTLYVSMFTISEVINSALRYQHKKDYSDRFSDFKPFRNSEDGKIETQNVYRIIKQSIIPIFEIYDNIYSNIELERFLTQDNLDFNDKILVSLCKKSNSVLFTDDYDFQCEDIEVLTINRKYFNN